jgi:DNA polymerase I
MERLHILDGYGYIFRAYYGLMTGGPGRQAVRMSTAGGMPTGALYVYATMLIRLHLDVKPERIAVVYDAPGPSFRSEIDDQYKATRTEMPDDLKVQMPYFRPLTEAFCWPVLSVSGVEADDVIATLVRQARARDWDVTMLSADKDMMQLIGPHVHMIDAMRDITYDVARVTEKFGVGPELVADWLALVGDTSDNIPGMAGVGKKTAAKLLGDYGSIDGILAHAGELKGKMKERFTDPEQLERLALSRKLVTLRDDVETGVELEDLRPRPWDGERLAAMFNELEFFTLMERLDPGAAAAAAPPAAPQGPAPQVVSDPAELVEWARAARAAGRFSVHVETDGERERTHVVGIALAIEGDAPRYLPIGHRYLSAPPQIPVDALPDALRAVLADPAVEVVMHDVKRGYHALEGLGLQVAGVVADTMLASYLLEATDGGIERVLKAAAGATIAPRKSLLGKGRSAIAFESVPVETAAGYSGGIAAALLPAARSLDERLEREGMTSLLRDLELPLARCLADIERRGISVDVPYLRRLADEVGGQIAALERQVYELAGHEINIGSPKQLAALLFDELGLTGGKMKKTKTGYSTDHEVLDSLLEAHPIVAPILEHRELCKLKGTYIDALPPLVVPGTGRVHTTFAQAVASTGRLSSQDPNLQNIPIRSELGRKIRRAFIAAEGMTLVSADYSQIELRVMAHLSGDPVLRRAFVDDIDVHTQTAAEVFGLPLDQVGPAERRVAKAVNYGLIYGQSEFGLARALDIPRTEARHYIERYFERFATVRSFMDEVVERARAAGAATTVLGRRRPIPEIASKNYQRRRAAERVAQNTPMQGSAADIMKLAMLRVRERLDADRFDAALLLTVHDELVLEVAPAQAEALAAAVKAEMEGAYRLAVPLRVDVGLGRTWADAH